MKKIIISSVLLSSMVFAAIRSQIPLPASQLSTDNNGSKSAIEAYRDGVGIYTVKAQDGNDLDNKEMNNLVFKYGEAAGNYNVDLKEYVLEHGDVSEKELASKLGKFEPFVPLAGSSCDDSSVKTINDRYVNGVCVGVDVDGKNCNDNNNKTISDKYVNGICIGTNVEGQTCNDNNVQTINDKYINGVCVGTNVEGQICNDNNVKTINDKYINGVCVGADVEGQTCNDNNANTINDKYISGICAGTLIDCNDNNANTNDILTNGKCSNLYKDGVICNDNNDLTLNDTYTNNVCYGKAYSHPNLKYSSNREINYSNNTSTEAITGSQYCGNFTLSFYAKTNASSGFVNSAHVPGGTEQFFFNANHGGESYDGVGISFGVNGIATYEHSSGLMPRNGFYNTTFSANTYYKITYVYEGSIPKLYVNNKHILTGAKSPRSNACSPTTIGNGSYSKSINGGLKNIMIWNKALNQAEISAAP